MPSAAPLPHHLPLPGVLGALERLGCTAPPPHRLSLIDPRLLAWLLEPQLVQKAEKELEEYGLQAGVC